MTKKEFLYSLEKGLSGLPKADLSERLNFYSEIIEDSIEDGLAEEQAVDKIGSVSDIINTIDEDYPLTKLVKNILTTQRKLSPLELTIIIVGSPIWVSLLIAFVAVIFSLYLSAWAVIISCWACVLSLGVSGTSGLLFGTIYTFTDYTKVGICLIGASLVCLGFFVFTFFATKWLTKATVKLTKKMLICIKKTLIKEAK